MNNNIFHALTDLSNTYAKGLNNLSLIQKLKDWNEEALKQEREQEAIKKARREVVQDEQLLPNEITTAIDKQSDSGFNVEKKRMNWQEEQKKKLFEDYSSGEITAEDFNEMTAAIDRLTDGYKGEKNQAKSKSVNSSKKKKPKMTADLDKRSDSDFNVEKKNNMNWQEEQKKKLFDDYSSGKISEDRYNEMTAALAKLAGSNREKHEANILSDDVVSCSPKSEGEKGTMKRVFKVLLAVFTIGAIGLVIAHETRIKAEKAQREALLEYSVNELNASLETWKLEVAAWERGGYQGPAPEYNPPKEAWEYAMGSLEEVLQEMQNEIRRQEPQRRQLEEQRREQIQQQQQRREQRN